MGLTATNRHKVAATMQLEVCRRNGPLASATLGRPTLRKPRWLKSSRATVAHARSQSQASPRCKSTATARTAASGGVPSRRFQLLSRPPVMVSLRPDRV